MRVIATLILLGMIAAMAACATDEDLGPTVISRVVMLDLPVLKAPTRSHLSSTSPCFQAPLASPLDCSTTAIDNTTMLEDVLPTCSTRPEARPCWEIVLDALNCFEADHQKFEVRLDGLASYDLRILVQCASR